MCVCVFFVCKLTAAPHPRFLCVCLRARYIEASKTRLTGPGATPAEAAQARRVLVYVFDTCLRLLHPYMPFVTETLWQQLPTDPAHGILANTNTHSHAYVQTLYLFTPENETAIYFSIYTPAACRLCSLFLSLLGLLPSFFRSFYAL